MNKLMMIKITIILIFKFHNNKKSKMKIKTIKKNKLGLEKKVESLQRNQRNKANKYYHNKNRKSNKPKVSLPQSKNNLRKRIMKKSIILKNRKKI